MDPKTAYARLLTALADEDWGEAQEYAAALDEWLKRGGFRTKEMNPITLRDSWPSVVRELVGELSETLMFCQVSS